MQMSRTVRAPSDRTLNRLVAGMALVLVIGIPLIGVLYFFDHYRSPGPSLGDQAISAAEDAVRASPNSVSVRFALAKAYDNAGRRSDAVAQYDQILELTPKAAPVLVARGDDRFLLNDLDGAASDYQAVVGYVKGAEMANVSQDLEAAYFGLGQVALKRGDAATAAARANDALKINRTDADALNLLGSAQLTSGDPTNAVAAFRQAIGLVPVDWCDPYAGLAKAYGALKDAAGATWANGMLAFCEGRLDEAGAQLRVASSGAYAVDALVGLGLLAEKEGDLSAAADAYAKALAKDPKNFLATTGLGRVSDASASSTPLPGSSEGK